MDWFAWHQSSHMYSLLCKIALCISAMKVIGLLGYMNQRNIKIGNSFSGSHPTHICTASLFACSVGPACLSAFPLRKVVGLLKRETNIQTAAITFQAHGISPIQIDMPLLSACFTSFSAFPSCYRKRGLGGCYVSTSRIGVSAYVHYIAFWQGPL